MNDALAEAADMSKEQPVTALVLRLLAAEEDKRRRLSRMLHDDIGQQITALRLALERHQRVASSDDLAAAIALTGTISRDIDDIARILRPATLDQLGLAAALPGFVESWASHTGAEVDSRVEGYRAGVLPPSVESVFYRIMEAALDNVAAHAHATRTEVVLAASTGHVALIVEDNGVGFDVDANIGSASAGLAGMHALAALVGATLIVESVPEKGTTVLLRYPLQSAAGVQTDRP
jgi:signal transduction histidine kinase